MIEATTDRVIHEVEYPYPIELVWKAITDREALSEWLMPTADFRAEVGAKFKFIQPATERWSGVVEGEVLEVIPPHRLVYSWNGGFPSTAAFALMETESGGTKVRFEMAGFDAAGQFGAGARKGADYFWGQKALTGTLPATLERLSRDAPSE
ncbi:MAG: SRPBCC domain-containing protein [Candidatus Dormibacteria bacterium]